MTTVKEIGVGANGRETATLAGGCFWCLEAVYEQLRGVERVVSGYSGGTVANPSYERVCAGATGHAEVVQITFDPRAISFKDLLEVFFTIHDPTTLDRQGNDAGTQYRSAIFYHSPEQKATAEGVVAELTARKVWNAPIVTNISPLAAFYPAEDHHQGYYRNNPGQGYCRAVIAPKVAKLRKGYFEKLKKA
ncbi:MAG: peptide-methionine (S)-S-oxide reductase MsrA [Gemmatimonadota bacterium]